MRVLTGSYQVVRALTGPALRPPPHIAPHPHPSPPPLIPTPRPHQVDCAECDTTFGFRLYSVGPRIEAALLEQARLVCCRGYCS